MGKLYTPESVAGGVQSQTTLNDNFDAIETALDKCVSRTGESPNSMSADLDMNSNHVLNVPIVPQYNAEAASKAYVDAYNNAASLASLIAGSANQWTDSQTAEYSSTTVFQISGNVASSYQVNRRTRAMGTSTGDITGYITAVDYDSTRVGYTTVTVAWDSDVLANEALTVYVGINSPLNTSISFPEVDVRNFGTAYADVTAADAHATAIGAILVFSPGTYTFSSDHDFTSPVRMAGGVLSGAGLATFDAGFEAPAYYCFDCNVGHIAAPFVLAEWFGARRTTATPTSTSDDISSAGWNTWPSWITGGTFLADPGHDYGDGTWLGANDPFSNSDSWDFIGLQRAVWSIGDLVASTWTDPGRGTVLMLGGTYYLSEAVRYTGDMTATLQGQGYNKTILDSKDWPTHGGVPVASGTARAVLHFYHSGPDPITLDGFSCLGPNGYAYGEPTPIHLITMMGSNGIKPHNLWLSTADTGIYMAASCSDINIYGITSEYCYRTVWGYDAISWFTMAASNCWQSGYASKGVEATYGFLTDTTFIGYSYEPVTLQYGSVINGVGIIHQDGTRSTINGRTISRAVVVPAGGNKDFLSLTMAPYTAIRLQWVGGGTVQGIGSCGIERTLDVYCEAGPPVVAGAAATKWGNGGATPLITETQVVAGTVITLRLLNGGAGAQDFTGYVTIIIQGHDPIIQGLAG